MPATPLVQVGATILCSHGGQVSIVTSNARVTASKQPLALASDPLPIAACPFFVGGAASPCLTGRFLTTAARVRVGKRPLLLQTSSGIGANAASVPQGPLSIPRTQSRVKGQ